jgi:hypothetical protein
MVRLVACTDASNGAPARVDELLPIAGNGVGALRGNDAQSGLRASITGACAMLLATGCAMVQAMPLDSTRSRRPPIYFRMLRTHRTPTGFIEPCLPTPAEHPPSGPGWIHEIKHDGFRIIARKSNGWSYQLCSS